MDAHQIRIEINAWADRNQTRIDRELTIAWPDLELRLRDLVDGMTLKELLFGPGKDFQDCRLRPIMNAWTKTHINPILEDAEKELLSICQAIHSLQDQAREIPGEWSGTLRWVDVLGPGTTIAGVAVSVAAVFLAITKVTTWIVLTAILVNWYLLIAGIAVGLAMVVFGGKDMLDLRTKLQGRFRKALLPIIREAILGESITVNGEKQLSVKRTLRDIIEQGKVDALQKLDREARER